MNAEAYEDWKQKSLTVKYSRTYVKGNYVRTWHNQTHTAWNLSEAKSIVNEWNRIAVLMHERFPQNGIWIYVEEK